MRRPILWAGAYAMLATVAAGALAIGILGGEFRAVERSDYVTYQTAGLIVLHGDGACLYTPACQSAAQHDLIGDEPSFERGALPFNSPPWLAALAAPLAALPLRLAFGIFTVSSLVLLAVAAWRLAWGGTATRAVATLLAAERLADGHGRHPRPVEPGGGGPARPFGGGHLIYAGAPRRACSSGSAPSSRRSARCGWRGWWSRGVGWPCSRGESPSRR